jgi:hypothetical protein
MLSNSFNLSVAPRKPRFKGRFITTKVKLTTDHEKGMECRLIVYSKGSRQAIIKFLWLKFLWDQLTRKEFLLFITFPEVLSNEKMFNYLSVINTIPKKIARRNLLKAEEFLNLEISSRERYHGIKDLDIEIYQETRNLPKPPKFSGYVKTPSSVGTKSSRGSSFLETTTDPDVVMKSLIEPISWYKLLTVGTDSLLSEDLFSSDEF